MNFDRIRFVSEETEIGERREAILACTIPETIGAFRQFVRRIGKRNVTEFNYRRSDPSHAHVFVGLAVKSREETARLVAQLREAGVETLDLSDDSLAKEHVRHMVGGHVSGVPDEIVCAFEFPERPGALTDFLEASGTRWDVTLFHYRNHGADHGRVLAGVSVPPAERAAFRRAMKSLGYVWREVTDDPAYRLFLGNRK